MTKQDSVEEKVALAFISANQPLMLYEFLDIVNNLLSQQLSSIREEVGGVKMELPAGDEIYNLSNRRRGRIEGYNQAISDILTMIKEKE